MLQRTLPAGFIAPCLPTKTDRLPSGSQWLHEIKHDGFRVIARKDGPRVLAQNEERGCAGGLCSCTKLPVTTATILECLTRTGRGGRCWRQSSIVPLSWWRFAPRQAWRVRALGAARM